MFFRSLTIVNYYSVIGFVLSIVVNRIFYVFYLIGLLFVIDIVCLLFFIVLYYVFFVVK